MVKTKVIKDFKEFQKNLGVKVEQILDKIQNAAYTFVGSILWVIVALTVVLGIVWIGFELFKQDNVNTAQNLFSNIQLWIGAIATGAGFSLLSFEYARLLKEQEHRNKRILAEKAAINFFGATILFVIGSIFLIAAPTVKNELAAITSALTLLAFFVLLFAGMSLVRGLQQIWAVLNPIDIK